jgi:hypothetical protein
VSYFGEWVSEWRQTPLIAWPIKALVTLVFAAYWMYALVAGEAIALWMRWRVR